MKKILNLLVVVLLFIALGCDNLDYLHITDRYYLVSSDSKDMMTLSYSVNKDNTSFIDVISENVFSVGFNDNYIIAKQNKSVNKNTHYYIVPIYKSFNYSPENGVLGPFDKKEFEIKRKELNIEYIKFQ